MTVDSKHEFHPDAESLNAFAEQAVGAGEREQIAAHLAECGRCREVVFLAQESAVEEEMEMVPQVAVATTKPERSLTVRPRFRGWRLVWVPAAAVAVLLRVAYVMHVQRAGSLREIAKAGPEVAVHDRSTPVAPPASPLAAPLAEVSHAESAEKALKPIGGVVTSGGLRASSEELADKQMVSSDNAVAQAMAAPPPKTHEVGGANAALQATGVEAEKARRSADSVGTETAVGGMPRARTDEAANQETVRQGLAAPEVAPMREQEGKTSMALKATDRSLATGSFAAYKVPNALPGGLRSLSSVTANNRTLAVDAAGSVYVREKQDGPWEAVSKQWAGRAVAVRMQAAAENNSPGGAAAAPVFEIVNDRGQVWTSTDGRIWGAK